MFMTKILDEINKNRINTVMDLPKKPIINSIQRMWADKYINTEEIICDPCCGSGCIVETLASYGFKNIISSDILEEDFIKGDKGVNVYNLKDNLCDTIITKPPFIEMVRNDMLKEFLRISKQKVILLLDINYLTSIRRKEYLESTPLKHIYINSQRIVLKQHGTIRPKYYGRTVYVWCIWDKTYSGVPTLSWI